MWFISSTDVGVKQGCDVDTMAFISVDELLVGQQTMRWCLECPGQVHTVVENQAAVKLC